MLWNAHRTNRICPQMIQDLSTDQSALFTDNNFLSIWYDLIEIEMYVDTHAGDSSHQIRSFTFGFHEMVWKVSLKNTNYCMLHHLALVNTRCVVVSYTQMNHTKRKRQKNDLSLTAITTTTRTAATAAYLTWWLYFVLLLHLLLLLLLRCDFYFIILFNSILLSSLSHSIDRLFFPALNDFDFKLWLSQRLTLCLRLFILLFFAFILWVQCWLCINLLNDRYMFNAITYIIISIGCYPMPIIHWAGEQPK